jgi:exportin-2 (importin alpha re-exporter)
VRDEDEELFDMNPIEYIRRDIEGGDSDTRRRAAADLVKALAGAFDADVTTLCTGYVAALLQVRLCEACAPRMAAHTYGLGLLVSER